MEKRFVLFIIVTMIVIVGYNALLATFGPKRPPPNVKGQVEKKQAAEAKADAQAEAAKQDKPDEKPAPPVARLDQPVQAAVHPHRVVTLGSYQGNTGSPLLVTLNSRGAAVERVELVGRKANGELRYRDLDNTGGYLGNLSFTGGAPRGCRVHVVPPGTPAASAEPSDRTFGVGLREGDLILSVNDKKIATPLEFESELSKLKPNHTVKLAVDRTIDGQTKSLSFTAKLAVRPFQMIKPEPLEVGEVRPHPLSMLLALRDAALNEEQLLTAFHNVDWGVREIGEGAPGIEFHLAIAPDKVADFGLPGSVEIIKRYRLGSSLTAAPIATQNKALLPYHLKFEIEIRNLAAQPQTLVYRLDGTNGLPTEGWWYLSKIHREWFAGAGARDILWKTDADGHRMVGCPSIFSRAKKDEKSPHTVLFTESEPTASRSLSYIGVDTQYFAAALVPAAPQPNTRVILGRAEALTLGDVTKKPKGWERTANVSYQLWSQPFTVEPQESWRQEFSLFAGPKEPQLLAGYQLSDWIYYGWFGDIAKWLSGILHFFHNKLVGNYAIAIVMLTVLVRGCMFPISRKAAKNAAMMQELAPEMRKIAEKYKTNMEARGKAQQELFRKHNYNPFSGCWMMFLQLPVFMGLYRCLAVDIELRQAPLIPVIEWCSNLAGPDKLFYWKTAWSAFLTDESGWLGPYFNVLPIFTIGLFLLQQKLFTPPATDEQTAMQLKMMKFMTVIMGVLFYKVPAGLCVYFITSSLWGIAERKLLPKPKPTKPDVQGGSSFSFLNPLAPKPDDNGSALRKKPGKRPKRK